MDFHQCGTLRVTHRENGFETFYRQSECPSVQSLRYIDDQSNGADIVEISFRDGTRRTISRPMKKVRKELHPLCDVYNWQYGIAVSYDGKRFYTSKWEGGVLCFDMESFEEIWKISMGSVREIFTVKDSSRIYCVNARRGLIETDAENGTELNRLSGSESTDFFRLDEETFLVGEKRGYYYIHRFDGFEHLRKIKRTEIVNDGKNWVFRNAWFENGTLCIDAFSNDGSETVFRYNL